jgi:hypothetical protein
MGAPRPGRNRLRPGVDRLADYEATSPKRVRPEAGPKQQEATLSRWRPDIV